MILILSDVSVALDTIIKCLSFDTLSHWTSWLFCALFLSASAFSQASLPKAFPPTSKCRPSKLPGLPSPLSSVLCPWVTSSADVHVVITSMQLPLKCLSTADLPHIGFTSHCLRSATSWQTACYQAHQDPEKELIKKQTQQHSLP